jgi:hypothetical protein
VSRSSSSLALVEASPSLQMVEQDTSLESYIQSQEGQVYPGRESSGRKPFVTPQIEAKICVEPWAIRHRMVHLETGLSIPMQCGHYDCLHCGPQRVAMWRSLVERAQPERFITLTRVGFTLKEVGRVATVIARRLRRLGYEFEYFMTFERHKDPAVGFHIHMLQKGDYIPQHVLSECLRSATHGRSFIVHIKAATGAVAGYITKYVTKSLAGSEIGRHDNGTKARPNRIRYSKEFFGQQSTKELKALLKAELLEGKKAKGEQVDDLEGKWMLQEVAELPRLENGKVDHDAAAVQYEELVLARVAEIGTDVKPVRGGLLLVVNYMLKARQDREEALQAREQGSQGRQPLSGSRAAPWVRAASKE